MLVNGKEMQFSEAITIAALLAQLKLNADRVVVEVNLQIVGKNEYGSTYLNSCDRVEIVSFVGGG